MYLLTTSFPYLVRRLGLRVGDLFDRRIAPYGVTVSMYRVMAALAEKNTQRLTELSEITTIEQSTLSRLIGEMGRKGLVSRRRSPESARAVDISLTADGMALAEELMPIAAHLEALAVAGLSPAEIATFKASLRSAYDNLDRFEAEIAEIEALRQAKRADS